MTLPTADLPAGTVATLASEDLDPSLMRALGAEFGRRGQVHAAQTETFTTRDGPVTATRWAVSMQDYDDPEGTDWLSSLLDDAAYHIQGETTTSLVSAHQRLNGPSLLVMDVDSTLINEEVIDILAAHAGREAEVAAVTERAMRGELDFSASLHQRIQALSGLDEHVFAQVADSITPTAGAVELIASFRSRGWPVCAVSGGFTQVLEPLAETVGLTDYCANKLEVLQGKLTGGLVNEQVIDGATKAQMLNQWAQRHQVPMARTVAVGDGANDLDMVATAGLGISFCAKPVLQQAADLSIKHRNLELIRFALGLAP